MTEMTGDQYQTLLGELALTRRYVDESIQRLAEETRRFLQHSAEETRRFVQRSTEEMRQYVDHSAEETRRHFGIVAEQLTGQIQLVAEGVSFQGTRTEAVRQEAAADTAEAKAQTKVYFRQLDRRVTTLESSVEDLNLRVGRGEASDTR